MSTPAVSVLLPVRNGLPWLREALDSLYAQTRDDFEIVVIDDGSTDGTSDWLRHERDPRLSVIGGPARGVAAALNAGLAAARADLIARQDADDRSHPDRFARQVAYLTAHPDVAVLATCADYIDEAGRPVENDWTRTVREQQDAALTPEALRALLPLTCALVHGSVMMRAAVVRAVGGYASEYPAAQDYDLWLRLLPAHRFAKLPDRLYQHRVHATQVSAHRAAEQRQRAVGAKLAFVRRQCPWLRPGATLAIADDTRGTAVYAAVAPEAGFTVAGPAPAAFQSQGHDVEADRWDVLAVTDFARVAEYAARLAPLLRAGRLVQEGNLFIRVAEAA